MNLITGESTTALKASALATDSSTAKAESPRHTLPEEPLVVIESNKSWVPLNLRDLWAYRELLYLLMWRDVKVRYKQTALGVLWVVMQPLLTTLVFTIFLGRLARVPSDGIPYSLFAYAGLVPWTFFSGAISTTSNSIVGNAHLITKVYFPRMIVPIATIGGRLIDLSVAFVVIAGLLIYHSISLTWNILMLPLLIVLMAALALACGMWTSALNVKYRDVSIVLPVAIQLWMFASPVVYPLSLVPAEWKRLYVLNPLVGIVEGFRSSLFGREFNWPALLISTGITLALLIYSAYAFRKMEKGFADIV